MMEYVIGVQQTRIQITCNAYN